jgi:hypothetical protein
VDGSARGRGDVFFFGDLSSLAAAGDVAGFLTHGPEQARAGDPHSRPGLRPEALGAGGGDRGGAAGGRAGVVGSIGSSWHPPHGASAAVAEILIAKGAFPMGADALAGHLAHQRQFLGDVVAAAIGMERER